MIHVHRVLYTGMCCNRLEDVELGHNFGLVKSMTSMDVLMIKTVLLPPSDRPVWCPTHQVHQPNLQVHDVMEISSSTSHYYSATEVCDLILAPPTDCPYMHCPEERAHQENCRIQSTETEAIRLNAHVNGRILAYRRSPPHLPMAFHHSWCKTTHPWSSTLWTLGKCATTQPAVWHCSYAV